MTCPQCRAPNPEDARFCEECGARLALACPQCGAEVSPGKKFCRACGTALSGHAPERPLSPASYTPKHLAEKILTSKAALEGERKQVTVLFADVKGSMELLADRDPEDARKLLDPVLERMMEAVHHYEGTVNQVMGDGIMALFGAPIGHEDHAVRACYAALRMLQRINLYADELQQKGGTLVQIRVGVNSGEVVVRAIGSDLDMDYTAVGQTTHLAARMEQITKPGSALVTGNTLRLAEGYVQVRPLGTIPVKGLEAPTPVYELTGTVPARSRIQASAARGLTRFIGRDTELQQLEHALARVEAGHGQAVAVVGEAGVGKSRLAWELTRSHRTHGWLVLEGGAVSYGTATPYLPVIELLKAYCRIEERDEPREIRERVAGKLLLLDREFDPLLTPLLALLDVPAEDVAWAALDPPLRRQRTLDAIKRLLLRESQVRPLLLLFEDLHWIDAETQALLDSLVESLPAARILLLVNYRPEYLHGWGSKTYYLQIRMDPLLPESADTLLTTLLGKDPTLAPLKRMLIARTEGNPFLVEECVRTLVETQALVGEAGAYRVTTADDRWQIPATAQAILAARIDRLGPEDKRLLQTAAVIGKDVPFALLEAVADVPDGALRQRLGHLQGAEFLYETNLFPDLQYTFKHAFTHEVAYAGVLHERRRTLHVRLVDAMERLYADRLAEHIEPLALHALGGEVWPKAVGYLRQAGAKAFGRSANREARVWFDRALDALRHLPETREAVEQAIDLRLEVRRSLFSLGEFTRIPDLLAESESLAARLSDQQRLGRIFAHTTQHYTWVGDYGRAVDYGQRAVMLAASNGDLGVRLIANGYLGAAYYNQGDWPRAIALFRANLGLVSDGHAGERFGQQVQPSVYSLTYLAWCLAERGDFAEGAVIAARGLDLAEELGQPFTRAVAYLGIGGFRLREGAFAAAAAPLEKGLALCREWDIPYWSHWITARLGYTYAFLGRPEEAASLLETSVEHAEVTRYIPGHAQGLAWLGEVHLRADRADAARKAGTSALESARRRGERGIEAWALRLLADIASHANGPDRTAAEVHYHHAIGMAGELGMRPLVAHCHLGLGKLYRRNGDQTRTQEHLTTAATMYREMGMTFWLEQAGSASAAGES